MRQLLSFVTPLALLLLVALGGCATAPVEPTRSEWAAGDTAYLKSPAEGAPGDLVPEAVAELRAAYRALTDGLPERADSLARTLEARLDPATAATTLRAQISLLEGDDQTTIDRLAPIVAREPDYDSARLALGRAYDRSGDLVAAYETLLPISEQPDSLGTIRQRVAELEPQVVDALELRLVEEIDASDFEAAHGTLDLLRRIAPDADGTHEAVRQLAGAEGDEVVELDALRILSMRPDFSPELLRRLADLELAVGVPATAMQAYETLLKANPGDPELTHGLERSKFQWRLQLLPRPVVELSQLPVLSRGDFAALTYWLVPTVRRGAPLRATIANDILDHPMREEIVRVVNLDLMDVDPVHRFDPTRPVRSLTVLRTFLEVIARGENSGGAENSGCTGAGWTRAADADRVCAAATGCGLIESAGECQPYSEVSGVRAVELGRAALNRLGAP